MVVAPDPAPGFTPKGKVYKLNFAGDSELDGLVVRARSAPVGFLLELARFAAAHSEAAATDDDDALAQVAEIGDMLERFGDVLIDWNLQIRPGQPTPADASGLFQLDMGQVLRLMTVYQAAVSSVPAPLPKPSSSGAPSLEGSLPMAPLSASPSS